MNDSEILAVINGTDVYLLLLGALAAMSVLAWALLPTTEGPR